MIPIWLWPTFIHVDELNWIGLKIWKFWHFHSVPPNPNRPNTCPCLMFCWYRSSYKLIQKRSQYFIIIFIKYPGKIELFRTGDWRTRLIRASNTSTVSVIESWASASSRLSRTSSKKTLCAVVIVIETRQGCQILTKSRSNWPQMPNGTNSGFLRSLFIQNVGLLKSDL